MTEGPPDGVRDKREALRDTVLTTAQAVLEGLLEALVSQDPNMVKACAIAYGVMVDKVAILEGSALPRYGAVRSRSGRPITDLGKLGLVPAEVRSEEETQAKVAEVAELIRRRKAARG